MKLLIINGPNLNLLGIREPDIYGKRDYNALCEYIKDCCKNNEFEIFQSNHEGEIVDKIQSAYNNFDAIIINPAAFSHTSIAILDALKAVDIPTAEVHLTDISKREDFRKFSFVSLAAKKVFMGKGFESYKDAIEFFIN